MNKEKLIDAKVPVLLASLTVFIGGCRDEVMKQIDETVDELTENCLINIYNPKNIEKSDNKWVVKSADNSVCHCSFSKDTDICEFDEINNASNAKAQSKKRTAVQINHQNSNENIRFTLHKGKKLYSSVLEVDSEKCQEVPYSGPKRKLDTPPKECRIYINSVRDRLRQLSGHFEKRSGK